MDTYRDSLDQGGHGGIDGSYLQQTHPFIHPSIDTLIHTYRDGFDQGGHGGIDGSYLQQTHPFIHPSIHP